MLFTKSFNNYEEFKNIFGIVEHGNGNKSRRNKILLSHYKNKELRKFCREIGNWYPLTISNMNDLKQWMFAVLSSAKTLRYNLDILGHIFKSNEYYLDDFKGVCEDGDVLCIRYIRAEDERIFKMKIGKFVKKIIDEFPRKEIMSDSSRTWLLEQISEEWIAEMQSRNDRYELRTGGCVEDFEYIYSSTDQNTEYSFGSCMTNNGQYEFYSNAVNATAAWLIDKQTGYKVARCVIFNDVFDENGKHYRLAERQYSENESNDLKRVLVSKLIAAKIIDGYKQVGVDCHNNRAYVSNSGESWNDKKFRVGCCLHEGDTLSYQDSFIYYDEDSEVAYNYDPGFSCEELNTTDSYYHAEGREWDSWHEEYCDETTTVYYHGREYQCDVYALDDFSWVDSREEYHHYDDVVYSEYYEEDIHEDDAVYLDYRDTYALENDCVELPGGEYALEKDCELCVDCGEYFLRDEMKNIDGEWLCEDCEKERAESEERSA